MANLSENSIKTPRKEIKLTLVEKLGEGSFGKCFLAYDDKRKYYACKVSPDKEAEQEIKMLSKLSHDNIVRFHSQCKSDRYFYLVMEVCDLGTLDSLLKCRKRLTDQEVQYIVHQMGNGLKYLHESLIIHRDLKPKNVFLTNGVTVKIGDFGLAIKLNGKDEKRMTHCGTKNYMAPEIEDGAGYGFSADIWAVGCITHKLLMGTHNTPAELSSCRLSVLAREFISRTLEIDPQLRPTVQELLQHPFLTKNCMPEKLNITCFYRKPQERKRLPLTDKTNVMGINSSNTNTGKEFHAMNLRPRRVASKLKAPWPNMEQVFQDDGKGLSKCLLNQVRGALAARLKCNWTMAESHEKFLCVSRWVAGIEAMGYQLTDESFGLLYLKNPYCTVHRSPQGRAVVYDQYGQKTSIVNSHLNFLMEMAEKNLKVLDKTEVEVAYTKPVVVINKRIWPYRRSTAINPMVAFLLSNGSCQVNFQDHSKLLVNGPSNIVILFRDNKFWQTSLTNLQDKGVPHQLTPYLEFLAYFLAVMSEYTVFG